MVGCLSALTSLSDKDCALFKFSHISILTKLGVCSKNLNSANQYKDYLPDVWKNVTPEQMKLGHGGMDYIQFKAFFGAILRGEEMPIDVYDMAAWMAITPLSEQSIAHGGMPQAIPDFTRGKWMYRPQKDVMELPTPQTDEEAAKTEFGYSRKIET